ncbi:MAG: M24 family metallopeptidase, partial [Prevotellaceae bacterium]|nr:M24 family metallopeptidase [Prevotellaceae bacterium]
VVRKMVGHGIGRKMHEAPEVPNFGRRGHGKALKEGMVICIEPMINEGTKEVYLDEDGWSLHTEDNKLSAHFELTVYIKKGKPEVLSTFEYIEKSD